MKRFEKLYGVTLTTTKQKEIVLILMALEAIFAFSYLGYIELDVVSTTTLHILVIVGAMTLGISASVPVALVFALSSMWIGTYSTAPLDQLFSPFVSGVPFASIMFGLSRILFAIVSANLFNIYFDKSRKHVYLGIFFVGMLCTFVQGIFMVIAFYLFLPAMRETLSANLSSYPVFSDWLSYVLAGFTCSLVHYVLIKSNLKNHLKYICDNVEPRQKSKSLIITKTVTLLMGILCILYLRKMIFRNLFIHNISFANSLKIDISALLFQELIALISLFGILIIIIEWIYEFYTIQSIKMRDKLYEQSVKISIDPLTGVYSRFAYNEYIANHKNTPTNDFVVFLIDINGLKVVNDTLGHEAGDELICGAAACITSTFKDKGNTYRIGGDEFVVFGYMNKDEVESMINSLNNTVNNWSGFKIDNLSISFGYAHYGDYPNLTIEELTKKADKEMYLMKKHYYDVKFNRI